MGLNTLNSVVDRALAAQDPNSFEYKLRMHELLEVILHDELLIEYIELSQSLIRIEEREDENKREEKLARIAEIEKKLFTQKQSEQDSLPQNAELMNLRKEISDRLIKIDKLVQDVYVYRAEKSELDNKIISKYAEEWKDIYASAADDFVKSNKIEDNLDALAARIANTRIGKLDPFEKFDVNEIKEELMSEVKSAISSTKSPIDILVHTGNLITDKIKDMHDAAEHMLTREDAHIALRMAKNTRHSLADDPNSKIDTPKYRYKRAENGEYVYKKDENDQYILDKHGKKIREVEQVVATDQVKQPFKMDLGTDESSRKGKRYDLILPAVKACKKHFGTFCHTDDMTKAAERCMQESLPDREKSIELAGKINECEQQITAEKSQVTQMVSKLQRLEAKSPVPTRAEKAEDGKALQDAPKMEVQPTDNQVFFRANKTTKEEPPSPIPEAPPPPPPYRMK